jgi:hypothetical protein
VVKPKASGAMARMAADRIHREVLVIGFLL